MAKWPPRKLGGHFAVRSASDTSTSKQSACRIVGLRDIRHSLGCSGGRIVTTLRHEMRRRGAATERSSMCIGVGQGIASLWEAA